MQNRWKSKVAWLGVVGLVGFILENYGLYNAIGLTSDTYQNLINLVFGVLTAFGIFNNPADSENF